MKTVSKTQRSGDRAVFMLTRCSVLTAMSVILYYIEIPVVAFYKLDLSALPALLAGFAMGPLPGFAIVLVKNLIHMLGSSTALVGEFADILMSGTFVAVASIIYRFNKSLKGAILAMAVSVLSMKTDCSCRLK